MSDSESDDEFIPIGYTPRTYTPTTVRNTLDYEHLLTTALERLEKLKSPAQKFRLPLDVRKDSPLKTSVNLIELSEILKRESDHLHKFITNELMTVGNLNNEGRLFLKGRFTKNQIQDILRNYVEVYVMCKSCLSVDDTELVKKDKLIFVKCGKCKAERSVFFR